MQQGSIPALQETAPITDYFRFALGENFGLTMHVSGIAVAGLVFAITAVLLARHFWLQRRLPAFEIDEAEFGLGDQKIKLRPNDLDRTVAYKIWVELSTRKIGLPIDPENDVISEVYDSWYEFFSITRELIKDVPVRKFQRDSTQKIISLSIDVLNLGLRPHLTRWQARFRRWYAAQMEKDKDALLHPQDIQKEFPDYEALVSDMTAINRHLMAYREKMRALITQI